MFRVMVEVLVERRCAGSAVALEAHRYASEGLARAVKRVRVGFVANTFAADSILLVSELQRGVAEAGGDNGVIQRCCVAGVHLAVDGKVCVLELEGLRARFRCGGFEVFGWTEEPVETDDGQVDDVGFHGSVFGVVDVEAGAHALEDGKADGVGARGWVVFVGHSLEERSE